MWALFCNPTVVSDAARLQQLLAAEGIVSAKMLQWCDTATLRELVSCLKGVGKRMAADTLRLPNGL